MPRGLMCGIAIGFVIGLALPWPIFLVWVLVIATAGTLLHWPSRRGHHGEQEDFTDARTDQR